MSHDSLSTARNETAGTALDSVWVPSIANHPGVTVQLARGRLYAALKSVSAFACKDETRFHLNGVFVELEGKTLTLVATDGHTLGRAIVAVSADLSVTKRTALLSASDVASILKATKGKKADADQPTTITLSGPRKEESSKVLIVCGATSLECRPIDAQFPPYRQVIPTYDSEKRTPFVGFNPAYMSRACDAITDFGRDAYSSLGAEIQFGANALDPIMIQFDGRELGSFTAVVMPMRIK